MGEGSQADITAAPREAARLRASELTRKELGKENQEVQTDGKT
jgi:hypothetical protein